MNIDVYLPSGQCASVVLPPHATVSDLAEYWGRGLGGQPGSWNLSKKQCRKNSITQMWWLKPFLNDNGNMERCGCMIVSVADDDCVVGIIPCLRRYTQFYRPNLWIGNWTLLLIRLSVRKFLQKRNCFTISQTNVWSPKQNLGAIFEVIWSWPRSKSSICVSYGLPGTDTVWGWDADWMCWVWPLDFTNSSARPKKPTGVVATRWYPGHMELPMCIHFTCSLALPIAR